MQKLKKIIYEFVHGHPFLLDEEVEIIVNTRLNDKSCKWMNDSKIKDVVKIRIKTMYKDKFPNAKRCSFNNINKLK